MAADCLPRRSPPAASPASMASHQPFRQLERRVRLPGGERRGDGRLAGQHVAGDADAGRGDAAAPFDAVLPGPGGGAAVPIHRVHLAEAAAGVARQRALDRRVGRQAAGHRVQDGGAEIAVGERLGGHRADARADERTGRADREGLGGDRDGEGAGGGVVGDDGPGHERYFTTKTRRHTKADDLSSCLRVFVVILSHRRTLSRHASGPWCQSEHAPIIATSSELHRLTVAFGASARHRDSHSLEPRPPSAAPMLPFAAGRAFRPLGLPGCQ